MEIGADYVTEGKYVREDGRRGQEETSGHNNNLQPSGVNINEPQPCLKAGWRKKQIHKITSCSITLSLTNCGHFLQTRSPLGVKNDHT